MYKPIFSALTILCCTSISCLAIPVAGDAPGKLEESEDACFLKSGIIGELCMERILQVLANCKKHKVPLQDVEAKVKPLVFHYWILFESEFKFSQRPAHIDLQIKLIKDNIRNIFGPGKLEWQDPLVCRAKLQEANSVIRNAIRDPDLFPADFLKGGMELYDRSESNFSLWLNRK
ncbi:MAG: hypothetical protein JWL81_3151 [Verrucomicrobiales bacterium]|nr:hypothetical protein [Verrucomicrobiales bacterium]